MQKILHLEDFRDKVGDNFILHVQDDIRVSVRLAAVEPRPIQEYRGRLRDPFSLMFDGEPGHRLPQRIYRLEHASGESYDIFIVPIQRNEDDGLRYQAVFN